MLMVPFRQTRLPQFPRLIYPTSAKWNKKSTLGEWNWHSVTTRTLLGEVTMSAGSAVGRQSSSRGTKQVLKKMQTNLHEEQTLALVGAVLVAILVP